jgi:hypothetical protein
MHPDLRAAILLSRPGLERHLGHAPDGRERLASEAQRTDAKEIFGVL